MRCECGHSKSDHLGAGRCDEPKKRCHCPQFRECLHVELAPWRDLDQCVTCRVVL